MQFVRYPLVLKKIVHSSRYKRNLQRHPNGLQLDWAKSLNNFGDILNPYIVSKLSPRVILNVNARYCNTSHLMAIGSILDRATAKSTIWGSGYISATSRFIEKPQKICAVRGPKTRALLQAQGVECPHVFGDPALLLPTYYKPIVKKEFELGILAHYVDKNDGWLKSLPKEVLIIDIQQPDPLSVVDQMLSCEHIASSSLHGLIVADAYKIPSVWIKLSDGLTGGSFKFQDYFASISANVDGPVMVQANTTAQELIASCAARAVNLDLDALVTAFPVHFT